MYPEKWWHRIRIQVAIEFLIVLILELRRCALPKWLFVVDDVFDFCLDLFAILTFAFPGRLFFGSKTDGEG